MYDGLSSPSPRLVRRWYGLYRLYRTVLGQDSGHVGLCARQLGLGGGLSMPLLCEVRLSTGQVGAKSGPSTPCPELYPGLEGRLVGWGNRRLALSRELYAWRAGLGERLSVLSVQSLELPLSVLSVKSLELRL